MSSIPDPEKGDGSPTSSPPSIHSSNDTITTAHSEEHDFSDEKKAIRNHIHEDESEPHHDALVPTVSLATAAQIPANGAQDAGRSRSRASTTRSRTVNIVPRSERRGLLGRLSVVPEVECPYDYKNSTKWGITLTIALATAAAPLGSSIFYRTQY
jgi:hypothetical protein